MKVDSDPVQTKNAHYAEPMEILMVKANDGFNIEVEKGEHISVIAYCDM